MTQKWNLQDIRPTEPRAQRRVLPQESITKKNHLTEPRPNTERTTRHLDMKSGVRRNFEERVSRAEQPETNFAPESYDDQIDVDRVPVINGKKRQHKHIIAAALIFFTITGIGVFISMLTGGATVTIQPKVRELNVNAEFTAYKEKKPEELTYSILTLEATSERQVEASGQEEVKVQATGEIEITKTTPGAERLIKNTRFATADGLVFRISESVIVPGAVTGTDGKSSPGAIRAQVFADEAGDKYNLKANTKLQVPGFKEGDYMDLYNAISATNPSAFTNGFEGPKFIIDDAALNTARQALQSELRDTLLARIDKEKPAGQTSFAGSVAIVYSQLPAVQYGDKLVTIKEQAVLQIPIFDAKEFAKFIAKETIVGYDDEPVRIDSLDSLNFSYSDATTSQSTLADKESLTFKIVGVPKIVWTFDEGKLKLDLLSKEKTAIPQILGSYPGIAKSEVKIRPVWQGSMPSDQTKITVIEDLSTTK